MDQELQELKRLTDAAERIVFFGGAGVSTESGLPDFRSKDGLYHQTFDYPPETILSHDFLESKPEEFFRFYKAKLLKPDARPNDAHRKLAEWEAEGKLLAILTQNVDGLHQAAGSRRVLELHGSVYRNYCQRCGRQYPGLDIVLGSEGVPRCECGGCIRPDVVLYGEALDENVLTEAVKALKQADLLIVGGTSLAVYPAAGLIRYFGGQHIVIINRDATPLDTGADLVLRRPIGQTLSCL